MQLSGVTRRGFVVGSVLTPALLRAPLSAQTPVTPAGSPTSMLPAGMLESAATAPVYETYVTHSTLQAPAATLSEDCRLTVYPVARRTLSAVSVLLRAADLTANPNEVLVQKMVYRDAALAESEYTYMSQEVVDVLAGMLIRQPQFAASDDPHGMTRRFEYLEANNFNFALQIQLVEAEIHVVRMGGFGDPHWDLVEERAAWLKQTNLDSLQRLEDHDGWLVSYGPFDFHPDAYQAPNCFGP